MPRIRGFEIEFDLKLENFSIFGGLSFENDCFPGIEEDKTFIEIISYHNLENWRRRI